MEQKSYWQRLIDPENRPVVRGALGLLTRILLAGAVIVGGIIYITNNSRIRGGIRQEQFHELNWQLEQQADVNHDHFVSHQEWADVYRLVRPSVVYDSRNPPSDLTPSEIEQFLASF